MNNNIKNKTNPIHMNLKNKMKLLFKSIFTQFGSLVSVEGQQIIWNEDGDLAEGYEVYMEVEDENGELQYVPVPDGEYKVEDKTIVVAEGKVSEIREETTVEPAEPENPANMEEVPAEPAEPSTEDVITEPEEPFNAEQAYNDLKIEFEAMKVEFDQIKEQLAKLLEAPADEDAFATAKKTEEVEQKGFICKVAKK